jgi:hypothetical protein
MMDAPVFGADHYRVVTPAEDWGDLDTPAKPIPQRLLGHFGRVEAESLATLVETIVHKTEMQLNKTRPDLNNQAGN